MCQLLSLSYGVVPIMQKENVDNWHNHMLQYISGSKLIKTGEKVILAEGLSVGQFDGADSMRIATVN